MAKALLLYAADAMDEAHNLVVRVSIGKRYKESAAKQDATYGHAMVHRTEGEFAGGPNPEPGWRSARMIFKQGRPRFAPEGPGGGEGVRPGEAGARASGSGAAGGCGR